MTTNDLTNDEFAARMREARQGPPPAFETVRVAVFWPNHANYPLNDVNGRALMSPCDPDDRTFGREYVSINGLDICASEKLFESLGGPDIYNIKFLPGKVPDGWEEYIQ